jgi:serine/threonine protein kinase/Flp pilus assembly protein TadD
LLYSAAYVIEQVIPFMDPAPKRDFSVFEAALRLQPEQRGELLALACGGDDQMRQELEARLQDQPRGDAPSGDSTLTAPESIQPRALGPEEQAGDRLGPYVLRQVLGQGGMGSVWMAEQTEPIRRKVAVKVVKAGLDSNQVLARFASERQVLALMNHPNIARVLDAGATPSGRPYFVMELVDGTPLTTFCDEERLSLRQRLELFVTICQGAQHAHQKGIIHRDLKPSNILVATCDARPVPKIIDFGVAKATGEKLTERTVFTQLGAVIGTLEYMSPEQAQLNQLDIDTRSDIYSLGVLLYELLTGTTPLGHETMRDCAFDELLRRIREEEPPRPSTRMSQSRALWSQIGERRKLAPAQLTKVLRGDLDWIVMKALEKDRARRYETANGLAMDLQRYLHNEPVLARPPTRVYRFQKLVRRHKLAFAAVAAVALSLLAGLATSTGLWLKEKAARQRAADEAEKSQQVTGFLETMLAGVDPSVAQGRDTTLLSNILDKASAQVSEAAKLRPDIEAELKSIIGHTYFGLGFFDKAEALQRQALALLIKKLGSEHVQVAEARNLLATTLYRKGNLAEAEALARQALETRLRILGGQSPEVAESLNDLSLMLFDDDQLPEAERLQRQALALSRKLLGENHPNVASSLNNLASMLSAQGKFEQAEQMQREELGLTRARLGPTHPDVGISLNNLAMLLCDEGKLTEAEALGRDALALRQKVLGPNHPDTVVSLSNLARILSDKGQLTEAEQLVRQALELRRKLPDTDPLDLAASLEDFVLVLQRQGHTNELGPLAREALAIREKQAPDKWQTFCTKSIVGGLLLDEKKLAEAKPLLVSGFEGMKNHEKEIPFERRPSLTNAAHRLVRLYEAMGQADKASRYAKAFGGSQPGQTAETAPPQPEAK